ncbi:MAG: HEAT repeat domain-containing protein [Bacteroidetes bacterium]|nr:HEAT repeat domain-containing protein [Bacteroidota bacterium]
MKALKTILVQLLLIPFLFTSTLSATDLPVIKFKIQYSQIEKTLLAGLCSDNLGLKISSAYLLVEIKSKKAVQPLTIMLRDSKDERERLVAALALIKIDTDRRRYVVKQGCLLNNSQRVRERCKQLYCAVMSQKLKDAAPEVESQYNGLAVSSFTE